MNYKLSIAIGEALTEALEGATEDDFKTIESLELYFEDYNEGGEIVRAEFHTEAEKAAYKKALININHLFPICFITEEEADFLETII